MCAFYKVMDTEISPALAQSSKEQMVCMVPQSHRMAWWMLTKRVLNTFVIFD